MLRHSSRQDKWDEPLFLSIIAATSYFLFRLNFFWSILVPKGDCLYDFWHPDSGVYFSPFWVATTIVVCLLIWSMTGLVDSIWKTAKNWMLIGFYVVAVFSAACWLYGMTGLWDAMRYERGEISAREFYGEEPRWLRFEQNECMLENDAGSEAR